MNQVEVKKIIIEMSQRGPTGVRGAKGDKGDTGAQGPKGDKGDPGTTSWDGIVDKPHFGALSDHDTVDYETEVTGKPEFKDLAFAEDAPQDSEDYVRRNGDWVRSTDKAAVWGSIYGNISDQADLRIALSGKSDTNHVHGNIGSNGEITGGSFFITDGDRLPIIDASSNNRLRMSNAVFDGETIDKALTPNGSFEPFVVPSMVSYTEVTMIATRDYTAGSLISINGKLYKTIASISTNGRIRVGENVVVTTLEEQLNGKANIVHNHDDRYYTESEMDAKLSEKSDIDHNHDDRYYTEAEFHDLTIPLFSTIKSYDTGQLVYYNDRLYFFNKAHSAGAWISSDATLIPNNLSGLFAKTMGYIANNFSTLVVYSAGSYVMYNGQLYRFKAYHSAGPWDPDEVNAVTYVADEIGKIANWIVYDFSPDTTYSVGDYVNYNGTLCRFIANHPAGPWNNNHVTYNVRIANDLKTKAPISSPALTGTPTSTTPDSTDNSTRIATTAFVKGLLTGKSDVGHTHDDRYYTETEIDNALALKADADSVYIKTETDTLLDEKADASSVYTKTETNTLLDAKADADSVYDKTETDIVVRDGNTAATGCLSDSIVSFNDGADSAFVKNLKVTIDPVQEGEGDPSPENIRPITGWTGTRIFKTRKNLLNPANFHATRVTVDENGVYTFDTSGYNADLYSGKNGTQLIPSDVIPNLPYLQPGTYTWSYKYGSGSDINTVRDVKLDGTYSAISSAFVTDGDYRYKTFTIDKPTRISLARANNIVPAVFSEPQLELGSQRTAYEPYVGDVLPISWQTEAGTVYGGSLNILTGMLTVDRVMVDLGQLNWSARYTGDSNETLSTSIETNYPQKYDDYLFISENYTYRGYISIVTQLNNPDNTSIGFYSYYNSSSTARNVLYIVINKNTTPSGKLVYRIASPQTIPLTPAQMQTFLGMNNIWADTGDVEVTYCKDTETYVTSEINAHHDDTKAPAITETVSGNVVSFSDGSTLSVEDLKVTIDPVQEGEGDPSPENIRPIYGWTGAKITKAKKNIYNFVSDEAEYTTRGITVTHNADGSITLSGTATNNICVNLMQKEGTAQSYFTTCHLSDKYRLKAGTYTISYVSTSENNDFRVIYGTNVGKAYNATGNNTIAATNGIIHLTLAEDSYLIFTKAFGKDAVVDMTIKFQIEIGETGTEYEPFTGEVLPIDFPVSEIAPDGIYYGGTVDVLAGTMTVNSNLFTFDGSDDEGWEYTSDYTNLENNIYGYKIESLFPKNYYAGSTSKTNLFTYNSKQTGSAPLNTYGLRNYNRRFVVFVSIDNLQDFKTFLGTNNLQLLVYYYQKPVDTVQLTPAKMQTLLGENHIWADTGDVNVTYRADSKMYIDQQIAESQRATRSLIAGIEISNTATKNYSSGDLVIVGDQLLKFTENTASGSAITVGSNVVVTTVAEQLLLLASA